MFLRLYGTGSGAGVGTSANGVILRIENNQNKRNELGLHHGDSTNDWDKSIASNTHLQDPAGLNATSEWDEYMNSTIVDVSITTYTVYQGAPADIHADMDVVIRTATGDVRATLGSDIATTTDIAEIGWVILTGTFTPAEYTRVDETDYLEIDLYAHITGNESNSTILKYMLNDKTVPLSNWIHI